MFSLESANLCTSESLSKLATDALNDCVQLEITALCSTFTVFLDYFCCLERLRFGVLRKLFYSNCVFTYTVYLYRHESGKVTR